MAIVDSNGLPVSLLIASAAPHEITLVRQVINTRFTRRRIRRLTGDKAYDSDPMDRELKGLVPNLTHRIGQAEKTHLPRMAENYGPTNSAGR